MPDYFAATIRMWPWCTDNPTTHLVAKWLTDNYGPLQAEDGTELVGGPIISPDGKLKLEVEEALEGVEEFMEAGPHPEAEPSLVDLMKAAGLTFVASDVARYGGGRREISWKPGLAELRERPLVAGGSPALSQPVAELLLEVSSEERLRGASELLRPDREPLERRGSTTARPALRRL